MPFDDPSIRVEIEIPHREEIAILDKMANILGDPTKWGKWHTFNPENGSYCLLGALKSAEGGNVKPYGDWVCLKTTPAREVRERLVSICGRECLPKFNDAPSTEHSDVLSLIQRTRASFE